MAVVFSNPAPTPGSIVTDDAIEFDAVNTSGGVTAEIKITFLGLGLETVHNGTAFQGLYIAGSSRSAIVDGYRYKVRRTGGWPQSFSLEATETNNAPQITSTPPSLTGLTEGDAFPAYTVTATGFPAPTFSATGLPAGVSLSSGGVFSGTITNDGSYTITITATNGVSPDDTQVLNFTVAALFDPMDLGPVLWLDAANFDGTDWADASGNGHDFTGTAGVSTAGTNSYASVSFNGSSQNLTGPTWGTIFGTATLWEVVICFRPDPIPQTSSIEYANGSAYGTNPPVLFGTPYRLGIALMRSASRPHLDLIEADRRPRAATWEDGNIDGNGSSFGTPIKESEVQTTRHGRSGVSGVAYAAGYKSATVHASGGGVANYGATEICQIGGNSSRYYAGKISHIFGFDRKLTDAEAEDLSTWINAQVGATHVPAALDLELPDTMMKIDLQLPDAFGVKSGMVVDLDLGVASEAYQRFRSPIGLEMYDPAARPNKVTVGAFEGLRFDHSVNDFVPLTSQTVYASPPASYVNWINLFGRSTSDASPDGYGVAVVSLDTFVTSGSVPFDFPGILETFDASGGATTKDGLKFKKLSGTATISFFDAVATVPEATICFVEFGLKEISGNTRSYIRVNNGAVVTHTRAGSLDLTAGNLVSMGGINRTLAAQHTLFALQTAHGTPTNADQQKVRDKIAAEYSLTLASSDLFA